MADSAQTRRRSKRLAGLPATDDASSPDKTLKDSYATSPNTKRTHRPSSEGIRLPFAKSELQVYKADSFYTFIFLLTIILPSHWTILWKCLMGSTFTAEWEFWLRQIWIFATCTLCCVYFPAAGYDPWLVLYESQTLLHKSLRIVVQTATAVAVALVIAFLDSVVLPDFWDFKTDFLGESPPRQYAHRPAAGPSQQQRSRSQRSTWSGVGEATPPCTRPARSTRVQSSTRPPTPACCTPPPLSPPQPSPRRPGGRTAGGGGSARPRAGCCW